MTGTHQPSHLLVNTTKVQQLLCPGSFLLSKGLRQDKIPKKVCVSSTILWKIYITNRNNILLPIFYTQTPRVNSCEKKRPCWYHCCYDSWWGFTCYYLRSTYVFINFASTELYNKELVVASHPTSEFMT